MSEHVLLVGATRGMGKELALRWSAAGKQLSILARQPGQVDGAHYYTDPPSQAIPRLLDDRGKLSHLVFFQRHRDGGDLWQGEFATSLSLTREVIELCRGHFRAEGASIVIVSSVAADFVVADQPVGYHVAKAGMVQMARFYALQLGKEGVRVNTISPSFLIKEDSRQYHESNPEHKDRFAARAPLGRMGTSEDLLNTVDLLCSPLASYLTGQDLILDGGMSLVWPGGIP